MDKPVTQRIKLYINGDEIDNTLTSIRKNLIKYRNAANKATEGTEDWNKYNKAVAELEVEYKNAREAQKAFREDTKLTTAGVSDSQKELTKFTGSLSNLFQGYKNGDLLQVQEGFNGVKSGIQGAVKAGIAFIATPIGAIIATLAGIGFVAKEWLNYNAAVVEAIRTTTAITGLTDAAADKARINAETLQEVYGADFEETLSTAKKLVTNFGISYDEAFATIEDGLTTGQIKNKEYFDSLSEYGVFFKSAGFSAQEFKDVISTGYDLGIYTDKLPDALKEADLALKEQTTATKDSLVNAFGAAFSNELLAKISAGEITTKEALQSIAEESEKANLSQQQFGQLTADVFKGAGEDVGGAQKIFEALTIAIDGTKKPLTESQQLLKDQATTTRELKEVSSALFATGDQGFGLLIDKAKLFGTKILVDILTAGVDVINWFIDLNNKSGSFSALITIIGKTFTTTFSAVGIVLKNVVQGFKGLLDIFEGIITLDFDKATEGFSKAMSVLPNIVKQSVDKAKENFEDIKNAFNGNVQVERITLDSYVSSGDAATENGGPTPTKTPTNTEITDEEKKAEAEKIKLAQKTEAEITEILRKAKEKRATQDRTALENEYAVIDEKYRVSLEKARGNADLTKELEDQIALEKKDAKTQHLIDFDANKKAVQDEIDLLNAETEEQKEILKAEQEAEKEALKLANLKLNKEEEIAMLALLEKQGEETIAAIKKKYADKRIKDNQANFKKELEDRKKLNNAVISGAIDLVGAESRIGQGLLAIKGILAAKEQLIALGVLKSKIAINAAEATSATAAGAAQTAKVGFPQNIPLLIGFAAQAVGIISAVKSATSAANKVKPESFDKGGYTFDGPYSGGLDGIGGQLAMIHPEEYMIPKPVMQMPEIPRIVEYLEAKRTGKSTPSLDKGGSLSTNVLNTDSSTTETTSNGNLEYQLERLSNHLDKGLRIYYGYEDEESRQKIEDELNEIKQHAKS